MENKILLIDDDSSFLGQAIELLKKNGYKVGFALNAEDGLTMLRKIQYDLIILDINMPLKNGFDVLKDLKTNKSLKLIPVLMSTSESDKEIVLKAIKLGADDYIVKPLDEKVLLNKVHSLLKITNFIKRWGILAK